MSEYNRAIARLPWERDDAQYQYADVEEDQSTKEEDLENELPTEPEQQMPGQIQEPAGPAPEPAVNPRLAFLGIENVKIKGTSSRIRQEQKPRQEIHLQRVPAPQAQQQKPRTQPQKVIVRHVRDPVPAPQPQEQKRTFQSFQFKKKINPVIQFHDVGGNPNTNPGPALGSKKRRRRK